MSGKVRIAVDVGKIQCNTTPKVHTTAPMQPGSPFSRRLLQNRRYKVPDKALLRELLSESRRRETAVRSGAAGYEEHVKECRARQTNVEQLRLSKRRGLAAQDMVALPVNSDSPSLLNAASPSETIVASDQRQTTGLIDKLRCIYIICCSLKNMKSTHVKRRKISMSVLWSLRGDPYATRPIVRKASSTLFRKRSVARAPSASDSRENVAVNNNNSADASFEYSSAAARRASLNHGSLRALKSWGRFLELPIEDEYAMKVNEALSQLHMKTEELMQDDYSDRRVSRSSVSTNRRSSSLVRAKCAMDFESILPVTAPREDNAKDARPDIKQAEELLRFREEKESRKQKRTAGSPEHRSAEEAKRAVEKLAESWLKMRDRTSSQFMETLRFNHSNLLKKYYVKRGAATYADWLSRWQSRGMKLDDLSAHRPFTKAEVLADASCTWISILEKETGHIRPPAASQRDDALQKIRRFADDDFTAKLSNAQEKMSVLAMSLPAYEMLTESMQAAFKFVLVTILGLENKLLWQYLKLRKLPVHPALADAAVVGETP